ncbi:MAG: LPP20 family lipoprotein, partial [Candidatus Cloacimonetes bacterium]|nr:LPP20 family lipoprotein [Candidatus Cloacimonadota bacterium]
MKYCYLALVFLLLGACSSNQSVPEWTNSIVHDPLYFSALIKVPTTLPDYRERAQELAANEIAMQISTTIDTQIKLTQTEIMGISGSEYIAQIRSSSSAQIKNLTPTMSYKSKNIYYVLYRVNKAEYYAQRERQRDIAVATAHDLLVQYDTNIHKPAVAIPLLLLALD